MPLSLAQSWEAAFGKLPDVKRVMFGPTIRVEFDNNEVTLAFPNQFALDYFKDSCLAYIKQELNRLAGKEIKITPILSSSEESDIGATKVLAATPDNEALEHSWRKLPDPKKEPEYIIRPRPDLTLPQFVVGDGNRSAFLAVSALAERKPGFEIVVVIGGTGVGKTHLAWGAHKYARETRPEIRIPHPVHAKAFKGEFTRLASQGKNADWRPFDQRYKITSDLLFFDDIHHLAGEGTLGQFNEILESALNRGAGMLMTSRWSLQELESVFNNTEIISRLKGSMIVKIEPPDFDTKVNILLKKSEAEPMPFKLDEDLAREIVRRIPSCEGRSLAGLVKSVKPEILRGVKPDLELFNRYIETVVKRLDFATIIRVVAQHFRFSVEGILSKNKMASMVWARHIAFYLCHRLMPDTNSSELARYLKKDPSTIAAGIKDIEKNIGENQKLREDIEAIEIELTS